MPSKNRRLDSAPKAKNIIADRLRKARNHPANGLTQDQLSGRVAALGVTVDRAAIAKIELGNRRVSDFELAAFAIALDVEVDWLLGMSR